MENVDTTLDSFFSKSLSSVAKQAGVEDYAKFQNAGYRGMYNMLNVQLARRRGVDKTKLFDTMGRTELAANLFRITQTEERIRSRNGMVRRCWKTLTSVSDVKFAR